MALRLAGSIGQVEEAVQRSGPGNARWILRFNTFRLVPAREEVAIVPLSPQEWRDAILSTVEDYADDRSDGA